MIENMPKQGVFVEVLVVAELVNWIELNKQEHKELRGWEWLARKIKQ